METAGVRYYHNQSALYVLHNRHQGTSQTFFRFDSNCIMASFSLLHVIAVIGCAHCLAPLANDPYAMGSAFLGLSMLTLFRKFARSWVSAIIIGLLVISFGVFGLTDTFSGVAADSVAKVAKKGISKSEYRAEFDRLLKRAKTESKRDVTIEEAVKEGLDSAVLERMVGDRAFGALTNSLGLVVSKTVVQSEIAKIPGFQDPRTQRFSAEIYAQALRENNYTAPIFEASVRGDLSRQALTLAASSGFRAPRVFASQTLAFGTERRVVTVVPVSAALAGAPRQPTEAQLATFYQENKQALTRPETRALTLAIASLTDFESKAVVDEAQVRQVFDRNKARASTPAKRSVVQISAPDKAKADQAAARLRAGEAPAAIATALGLAAPITLTDVAQTGIPDENVAKAAFATANGGVAVVAAKLQPFAAFKVTSVTAPKEATLAELGPEIRKQMRAAAAGEAMTSATEAFDSAIAEGATLEVAAQKAGFKLVKVGGIIADGRSIENGQPLPELAEAPAILRDIFSGAKGDISDLASMPGDRYVSVRIDNITPAAAPPLAEVRPQLLNEWLRRDVGTRLKVRADEILAEAKKSTLEAAAAKFGLPVLRQAAPLQRGQGGQDLSSAVFGAKKGDVIAAQTANGVEYAIVRVEDILRDNDAKVPERMTQAETAVRESVQRDLIASLERVARDRAKTQLFPNMVRSALGLTGDAAAPAGATNAVTPPKKTP
jgi:peptidyl-prolyl cis-trans isomerase D